MPMTVGRYLKSQREEQGQGVAEVADMLCISRIYLQAIDDNEIDKIIKIKNLLIHIFNRPSIRFPEYCPFSLPFKPFYNC